MTKYRTLTKSLTQKDKEKIPYIQSNYNLGKTNLIELQENVNYKKEKALWKAVVMQALVDMASQSSKKMAKINRVKSILWANLANKDFLTVCSFAGLDAFYAYQKVLRIKKDNPLT